MLLTVKAIEVAAGSDDNDGSKTAELQLLLAATGANSSSQWTAFSSDDDDDNDDYVSTDANEAAISHEDGIANIDTDLRRQPSNARSSSRTEDHLSINSNKVLVTEKRLPVHTLGVSSLQQQSLQNVAVPELFKASLSSPLFGSQQLSHAVISDRQRLPLQKQRIDVDNSLSRHSLYARRSNKNEGNLTGNNSRVSAKQQLPTLASHVSPLRQQNVATPAEPLNSTLSSSSSSILGRQELNYAVVSEKRRLALRKERIRTQKLRFVNTFVQAFDLLPSASSYIGSWWGWG